MFTNSAQERRDGMKIKISILTFCYTLFIILLVVSGSISGVFSSVVYYLAFALPIGISLFMTRNDGIEATKYLTVDKSEIKRSLPLIFPTISVIMLIASLTSLLIFAVSGRTNEVDVGDSLPVALITHALLPALLEEAIFRYLPMRLLSSHSKRGAILISAFFFSLAHADLFTIPYAFAAGAIFMIIDLFTDSVIPSVIIHFINNALSIFMIFTSDSPYSTLGIYVIVFLLTLISIMFIIEAREKYKLGIISAMQKGERTEITVGMVLFALFTLTVAVLNLL